MITVADIIALPAFERIELAAPCAGAGAREVRNVGILDLAPDEQAYCLLYTSRRRHRPPCAALASNP